MQTRSFPTHLVHDIERQVEGSLVVTLGSHACRMDVRERAI
jgi:hypothetical protein